MYEVLFWNFWNGFISELKIEDLKLKNSEAVGSFFILLIRFYQVSLGRFLGGQCRFLPTCSQYAIEAIREFGALKGGYMAAKRIVKCHPFGGKGFDPVVKR